MNFEDALRAHGLLPRKAVVADGKIYRCPTDNHPKKRNGVYMLALDGRFGFYRDWAIDGDPVVWRAGKETESSLPVPVDFEAERKRRLGERQARRAATAGARDFFNACEPLRRGHDYLEAHGLDMTGCSGLRIDKDGWLVVPATRDGRLVSVQRIAPDGTKRFWPGAPMTATSYVIDRKDARYTVLCEGLATGLALFACSDLVRVVVGFYASNLVKVAERWPYAGFVCVAADNDWKTAERIGKNPGVLAAEDAARVLGCGVMVPLGIEGTDWSDWIQEKFAERMERKGEFQSVGSIRKTVGAEVFREVQKHSVYKILADMDSVSYDTAVSGRD